MKKVGIISELKWNDCNYGSKLQSYALNNYINTNFDNVKAESIIIDGVYSLKTTEPLNFFVFRIKEKIKRILKKNIRAVDVTQRNELCKEFVINNIKINSKVYDYETIAKSDYDILIVGSDVVWMQYKYFVNRIYFLDFNDKYKKVSYAASFGRNYVPQKNKKFLKKYLDKFDYISVREESSIKLLKDIGINNAKNVCDPTLLLTKKEWSRLGKKPSIKLKRFIFVYLLGDNIEQRKAIEEFSKITGLEIVTIPYANEKYNEYDHDFGKHKLSDCSPENWLWLIQNAEYIVTDSFHGTMLSTIFEKKFFVLKRKYNVDINVRLTDFLKQINQDDKYIDVDQLNNYEEFIWNYKNINSKLEKFKRNSIQYLKNLFK